MWAIFYAIEDNNDKSKDEDEPPPGNESSTNNEPMLEPAIELAEADIKRKTNNELKVELKSVSSPIIANFSFYVINNLSFER